MLKELGLNIAETLWNVGKDIYDRRQDFQKARRERRRKLAHYFGDLASLIESVSASLKINKYPHGTCAQLEASAKLMTRTVKGLVDAKSGRLYQDKLMEVWEIEQLYHQLQGKSKSRIKAKLIILDEAAGFFRATAAHLRVI